jgi:hypothetical protein
MIVIPNSVRVVAVISALALAGGLLTLALLVKPAQAQAETITDTDRSTFNKPWISCTGEEVLIQGISQTVAHTTTDENGVFHTVTTSNVKGHGESASAKYVFNSTFHSHENITGEPGDNYNGTFMQTVKLIRQGSDTTTDDLEARLFMHMTLNDQGEVTSEVIKVEDEVCT